MPDLTRTTRREFLAAASALAVSPQLLCRGQVTAAPAEDRFVLVSFTYPQHWGPPDPRFTSKRPPQVYVELKNIPRARGLVSTRRHFYELDEAFWALSDLVPCAHPWDWQFSRQERLVIQAAREVIYDKCHGQVYGWTEYWPEWF